MIFIIIFVLISFIHTEISLGEWKHYTSHLTPTDIVSNDNLIYISTSGGILEFNIINSELNIMDNYILSHSDINTMAIDSIGNLIIGNNYPTGNIQIYNKAPVFDLREYNDAQMVRKLSKVHAKKIFLRDRC